MSQNPSTPPPYPNTRRHTIWKADKLAKAFKVHKRQREDNERSHPDSEDEHVKKRLCFNLS